MYWHIDTDIVSLIVLCVMYLYNRTAPAQSGYALRNRRFNRCLLAGIIITVLDIAASVVMEVPASRLMYHLLMSLYFIALLGGIVEWFMYVNSIIYQNDVARSKRVLGIILLGYAIYALFVITNPWTGLLYSLGPHMEYSRGPLFPMTVLAYAIYVIALFVTVIVRWRNIPAGYPGIVLLLVPVILALGITVQLMNPGWLMILPTYMICMVLTNQFLQSISSRDNRVLVQRLSRAAVTDPLTGLLNRAGLKNQIDAVNIADEGENCVVILADIDDLKGINDTLGHQQGDRAIKLMASKLSNCFTSRDVVSRYGGDEFLIVKPGEINHTFMHMFLRGLIEELSMIYVGENNDVRIHASVGASVGKIGSDDIMKLSEKADIALYHAKRSGKCAYAVYTNEMDAGARGRNAMDAESA